MRPHERADRRPVHPRRPRGRRRGSGTESATTLDGLKDILLTDALNLLVVPEGRLGHDLSAAGVGARFHKGFVDAIAEVGEPLAAAVGAELQARDRPLWITGHSLGGAHAPLAGDLVDEVWDHLNEDDAAHCLDRCRDLLRG